MSEVNQIRRASQENIQMVQQEKAEKKRQLAEQQREDIRELKAKYQEMSKEIDQDSAAAINHIKYEANEANEEQKAERQEVKAAHTTYNRKGTTNRNNQDVEQSSTRTNRSIAFEKPASTPVVQNYETKDTDNFYKVQDRGSRVSESNEGYVIEAYAPEHEKDNLRVSVANNRAVISGKRKFQDSVEEGNKKISTNNFQTFHEEFKFERPVASEGMTREREGDYVKFFIPKLESVRFDEES